MLFAGNTSQKDAEAFCKENIVKKFKVVDNVEHECPLHVGCLYPNSSWDRAEADKVEMLSPKSTLKQSGITRKMTLDKEQKIASDKLLVSRPSVL